MTQTLLKEIEKGTKNALLKKKIITHYIYNGCSTITELAKELNLSIPTVTKFISEMNEEGYINDYGKLETSGGRHPVLYGLNPESGYFVGVDVERFAVNIGLINFKGDLIYQKTNIPYDFVSTPQAIDELCDIINKNLSNINIDHNKILNICVDIPGRINTDSGYSFSIFNFSELPLSEVLTERIGYPVYVDNDSRALTYGEFMKGCVNGEKNILFINASWGLGIGIIINGHLYYGKSGFAGEFGHINTSDNQILCHCGKKGCLETEASGRALHRILLERIAAGETSVLTKRVEDGEQISLSDIIDAINKEDPLCIEIIENIGHRLGKHVASLINIFNPELVIIGGTLSLTDDYITEPIKSAIRKYSLNLVNKDSTISVSKLKEKAGIVGACMLARSRMFEG